MRQVAEFAQSPEVVVIETVKGTSNIWIRTNIEEIEREEGAVFTADEAFMVCPSEDAPSKEEVEEDIDTWFEYASEWKEETKPTIEELSAKVDYLEIMIGG